jgi:DNA-binding CsgD family transcriptional regulator
MSTPLSPRQRQVLQAIFDGKTREVVARDLGIKPNTVRTHMQSILGKLGVSNQVQAVMVGLQRGEILLPETLEPERCDRCGQELPAKGGMPLRV